MRLVYRHILISCIACLAVGGTSAADSPRGANGEPLRAMADLDRAFIPVLFLTSQGKTGTSQQAMSRLVSKWPEFRNQISAAQPGDAQWQAGLEKVDRLIATAQSEVLAGELPKAHETLEAVRPAMTALRGLHQLPYFIDALNRFHESMESIVRLAAKKEPADLTDDQLQQFQEKLFPDAKEKFDQLEATKLDNEIFSLSDEQLAAVALQIQQERAALTALGSALQSNDRQQVLTAARALKPPFVKLFTVFGDFAGLDK